MEVPRVQQEAWRFYDGGVLGSPDGHADEPPNPAARPRIQLVREPGMREGLFRMQRRLGYHDRELGHIVVPRRLDTFDTDLTSVPALFTWLVPKDGAHLQAAIVHDGLYDRPNYDAAHEIDTIRANRVFRDAMADSGTARIRRWLMWAAVTTAALLKGRGARLSRGALLHYRVAIVATLVVILCLGVMATVDLLDVDCWVPEVPWMPENEWYVELAQGLAGAVVLPFLFALAWGRFWSAGVIVGVSLAVLLHVTIALVAITLLYRAAERLAGSRPRVAVLGAAAVVAGALVVFVTALV